MKRSHLLILAVTTSCAVSLAQDANLVRNGGFERDSNSDGMADHWEFSGDSSVKAEWTRDDGYAGAYSQRLTCSDFASDSPSSHAMLCQLDTLRLEKGKWYRIAFAARQRDIPGGAVSVAISNTRDWTNCGLRQSFRAAGDWKAFDFHFQATETIADHIRLQFWYTSTGSLWLDDVRVEPSAPVRKRYTEAAPPAAGRNLIHNGSFECGAAGWGSIADLPGWGGNLNHLVGSLDTTTGKLGRTSIKIALSPDVLPIFYFDYYPLYRVPVKAPLLANRGWIDVQPGEEYTLSAWMKANVEDLAGILSARQATGDALRKNVRLTTSWQRYSYTFRPRSEQLFVALGADLEASDRASGTVWIDGVQLEKGGKASAWTPGSPVAVGVQTDQPGNLFAHGSKPRVNLSLWNSGEAAVAVILHVRVTDFDDSVVYETDVPVSAGSAAAMRTSVELDIAKKGFYRLHVESQQAIILPMRSLRIAIIEPYTHSDSLFGMNHAWPWPQLLDLSERIGLVWFRDWSLKWHDVEPRKGRFTFEEPDRQINRVLDGGLKVLPVLPFPSSHWASSAGDNPGRTASYMANREHVAHMPTDPQDFAAYVRATVSHYRDRLNVWEILNEPIYTAYALPKSQGYTVHDYVRLLKLAYQAVKDADADATVVGGIAGRPTTDTFDFIEAGGLKWVDALNLHIYPGLQAPDAYEQPLQRLRQRMHEEGHGDKPIWFTEGAYYADDDMPVEPFDSTWLTPTADEMEAAEWQVKFNTLLLANGAEKIIYHSGTPGSLNNESLSGVFFEWGGEPRKMVTTQAAMANLLVPPIRSHGPTAAPDGIKAYRFESRGRTVIVAWAKEGAEPLELSWTPGSWILVDVQGNDLDACRVRLTQRPVYLVSDEVEPQTFPW